jgi:KDEL-tailed cysteine endopeptidase
MKSALTLQPIVIAIDAASDEFKLFGSGVFNLSDCNTRLNHAMLAVGYGIEGGIEYWLVKNSWGQNWGENGYIRIQITEGQGICGC